MCLTGFEAGAGNTTMPSLADGFYLFGAAIVRVSLIQMEQCTDFSAVTYELCSRVAELYDHDGYK